MEHEFGDREQLFPSDEGYADEHSGPHPDDVISWCDGTWCNRDELPGYSWMSDDYNVISVETPEWFRFHADPINA